jgi:hypothetical protein
MRQTSRTLCAHIIYLACRSYCGVRNCARRAGVFIQVFHPRAHRSGQCFCLKQSGSSIKDCDGCRPKRRTHSRRIDGGKWVKFERANIGTGHCCAMISGLLGPRLVQIRRNTALCFFPPEAIGDVLDLSLVLDLGLDGGFSGFGPCQRLTTPLGRATYLPLVLFPWIFLVFFSRLLLLDHPLLRCNPEEACACTVQP